MEASLTKRDINAWYHRWHLGENPFFFSVTLSFPLLSFPCQLVRRFIIQRDALASGTIGGSNADGKKWWATASLSLSLYLSLSDRFVSKRVDDLGIVKRTAKYNERTRRFDGSRSFWSGIILTRDVWSKTFLFFSFFILFYIFLVLNMNTWFGSGSKPRLS